MAFLGIAALKHGFTALEKVGGMVAIEKHTSSLASELHHLLLDLKHSNGEQACGLSAQNDLRMKVILTHIDLSLRSSPCTAVTVDLMMGDLSRGLLSLSTSWKPMVHASV